MIADAAIRLAAVFVVAGVGLLLAGRHPDIATLTARARTWVVIAAVWLTALAHPVGIVTLAATVGLVCALEYRRLMAMSAADGAIVCLTGAVLPLLVGRGGTTVMGGLVLAVLAATVPPLLQQDVEEGWTRIARSVVGLLWVGAAAATVAALSPSALLALGVGVALADIGAFIAGSALGGPKLASRLSPGKTWAGLAGGVAGANLGVLLVADLVGLAPAIIPLYGLGIAIAATWGDLLESLVKRTVEVKDAGSWLPGFGGLLDRADSLLVTAPLWWASTVLL